jgi:hypothetical protein
MIEITNDYESFEGLSKSAVLGMLPQFGSPTNLTDTQNSSPTFTELVDLEKLFGDDISYEGYIIKKPREDYRVSIEGFTVKNISADEILMLQLRCPDADECTWEKNPDDTYNVRFWWD